MVKKYNVKVNGKSYSVEVEELGNVRQTSKLSTTHDEARLALPGSGADMEVAEEGAPTGVQPAAEQVNTANGVTSPLSGTIQEVLVSVGDNVHYGDKIIVLDAMKMENEIVAPKDGSIAAVCVAKGDAVQAGQLLVSME